MAIILRLDRMMADRKISLNELSEKVGVANVNLSKIKTGKVSAIRFSTLMRFVMCWTASRETFWNFKEMRKKIKDFLMFQKEYKIKHPFP